MNGTKKESYVVVEPGKGSPRIRGKYDLYVTPWRGHADVLVDYLESLDPGETVTLRLTVHEWTGREYEEFVEANEIEWEAAGHAD